MEQHDYLLTSSAYRRLRNNCQPLNRTRLSSLPYRQLRKAMISSLLSLFTAVRQLRKEMRGDEDKGRVHCRIGSSENKREWSNPLIKFTAV